MASKQIWIFSTRDRMECCKNILQKMADLKTLGIGTVCRLGFDLRQLETKHYNYFSFKNIFSTEGPPWRIYV